MDNIIDIIWLCPAYHGNPCAMQEMAGVRPPGSYNLTITAAGFDTIGPAEVGITEGGTLSKNIGMTPTSVNTVSVATIASHDSDVVVNEGDSVNFLGTITDGNVPFTYLWDFAGGGGCCFIDVLF